MGQNKFFTKTKLLVIGVFLFAAAASGAWLVSNSADQTAGEPSSSQVAPADTQQTTDYVTYQGEEGKTALELLKSEADVKTEQHDFGELVTSIDGVDGGGEKYWTFYVNGEMAQAGAGEYETKNGDTIEWKLQ